MRSKAIDLGLGDLGDFEPTESVGGRNRVEPMSLEDRDAIDAISVKHGFAKVANTSAAPRRMKRSASTQMHQINVRAPVNIIAKFMEFCDRERLTYGEGIENLMSAKEDKLNQ